MNKFTSSVDEILQPPEKLWGRFLFIGPSLVLTATLVGSGELIITTTFGAQAGFTGLWLIVGACFLKVAMQESLGRYAISESETGLQILDRIPGPRFLAGWGIWVWLLVVLAGAIQLGGVADIVGQSMNILIPNLSARAWAPIMCFVCLAILFSGRYGVVETVSVVLVSLFSISIIICSMLIQRTPFAVSWSDIAAGFQFQLPAAGAIKEGGLGLTVSIVAAVGLSATELIYYPYWCLEKGYARFTGPNDGSQEWLDRAKGWIRVMHLDCFFAMLVYTTTTVAFYLLGAAVLHRRGDIPEGIELVQTLSVIYTEILGPEAYWVFVVSALMVLFSTLFVTIAGYSRLLPDCMNILGFISFEREKDKKKWIRIFLLLTSIVFALASQIPTPAVVKLVMGFLPLAVLLPVVCIAAIYLRYFRLDRRLTPHPILDIWLWGSAILSTALTALTIVKYANELLGAMG